VLFCLLVLEMYSRIKALFVIGLAATSLISGTGCGKPDSYIEKGNKLLEAHQYEAAILLFRKAIQKDPNNGEAYYRLGLAEMAGNHGLDAYEPLLHAVQLMPKNEPAKVKLADLTLALLIVDPHHPAAHYQQVEALADQLLNNNPNSFDGLRLKASLRLLDHKPKEAILLFEKANQIEPMRPDLIQGWVQALFQDGQVAEGEQLGLRVVANDKTFGAMYDVLYHQYMLSSRKADAENILKTKAANNPKDVNCLLQLARHYASTHNPDAMNRTLARIANDPKDFPDGQLHTGNFFATLGQWDRAFRDFEEGARSNPKAKLVYEKRMMDMLLAQGKKDEARRMVELVLQDDPNDEDARRVRATLRLDAGGPENVAAALVDLNALLAGNPNDARLRSLLGHAYLAQGRADAAWTEFQQVIGLNADDVPSHLALAAISLNRRHPEEAIRYTDEVLTRDPTNGRARLLKAAAMTSAGYYGRARTELMKLLHEYPKSSEVQFQLGLLALAGKKYADAEAIFRKLGQAMPGDAGPAAALVATYSAQNQADRAIELLKQDLKTRPDSVPIRRLLALTAAHAHKFDLAISEYRKLLANDSKSVDLRTHLAEVYRLKGDLGEAIAVLDPAVQLAPNDPQPAMLLASLLVDAGRYKEAQTAFKRVLELRPGNPFVLNNMAFVLAESGGNLDEALQLARRALEKSPENPVLVDTLGWIYLKKGDKDSALQSFSGLVQRQPQNPTFHYHYAMALLEKGDRQRAKSELQNALASGPLPDIEQKIRALANRIG
jgi:tetratricopeptide (TPR) repeat protein